MKALAALSASLIVLGAGSLVSAASTSAHQASHPMTARLWLPSPSGHGGTVAVGRVMLPADTNATPTPTAATTPQPTETPQPTATTGPSYPDPVSILQGMFQVTELLVSTHFTQTYQQTGAVNFNIAATGDAVCKGPALKAHVTAKASLAGTAQSQSSDFYLIQVKKNYFRRSKSTHNVWQKAKAKQVAPYGFTVDNPLPCPNTAGSSSGGSGSPSSQIKNLVNLGPTTVNGVSVWHIHAIDVEVDSTGATLELPVDWYVSQDHSLLYKYTSSVNDTNHNEKATFTLGLSKFGEKITIKSPKLGSSKP